MLTQSYLTRASLQSTRNELAEVLPHLRDDMLNWAPAAGMRTIKGQFVEILGTEVSIMEPIMKKPKRSYQEIDAEFQKLSSVAELIQALIEARHQTLELLSSLGEDGLSDQVEVSEGYAEYMGLEFVPCSEMFRMLVRHEAYHTGQLVSYLWACGNDPYSWE